MKLIYDINLDSGTGISFYVYSDNWPITIVWGDGNSETFVSSPIEHTYEDDGVYTVEVHGDIKTFIAGDGFNIPESHSNKLTEVVSFGNSSLLSSVMFDGCENLTMVPDTLPPSINTLHRVFRRCTSLNDPNISNWDVSNVVDMYGAFDSATTFNQPLNSWNVSNVTDMSFLFYGDGSFNQPLSSWNVANVESMVGMFFNASVFDQPLDIWNVANVENMEAMFAGASAFNQPLNSWNVSNVTNMRGMFNNALSFNQPLGDWDVSSVMNMDNMFTDSAFDQNLSGWCVTNVTSEPKWFASNAPVSPVSYPDWGNCPQGVTPTVTPTMTSTLTPTPTVSVSVTAPVTPTATPTITPTPSPATALELSYDTNLNTGNDVGFYVEGTVGDISVDWGDGNTETPASLGALTHTYNSGGVYNVKVYGNLTKFYGGDNTEVDIFHSTKLVDVIDFGNAPLEEIRFYRCNNLSSVPSNLPSSVTSLFSAFRECTQFNDSSVSSWDVSNVTDMAFLFSDAINFNQPLNTWNTASLFSLTSAFNGASSFNQPLDNWDVSGVTNMVSVFAGASSFDRPLNTWNVSNVTTMSGMFNGASSFNQPLNNWDVSSVTSFTGMESMFRDASMFNQSIDGWNVSNVKGMAHMFNGASAFNQPLNSWNVSSVTNMSYMFRDATNFNQPIGSWNVGNVTTMEWMFEGATSFDQPLDTWNVSNVTDMSYMLSSTPYSQPLNSWDVSSVTDMTATFYNASSFNQPLDNWDVANVTSMTYMFYNATVFNQDLSEWCVTNITSEPFSFATNSALQSSYYPVWGTCPPLESPTPTITPTPTVTPSASATLAYGPGPQTLQAGDFTNGGYFGETSSTELFSGDALATEIGLSTGASQHSTVGWLKFWHEGKVKYIAKRPFRHSVSWDAIYAAGVVYGTDDNGSNPTGTATNQYTTVSTSGYSFLVRLMTGSDPTISNDYGAASIDSCTYDFGGGSEWNELIYRIHQTVPDCSVNATFHGGPQVGGNWANLTNTDIVVVSGDGHNTWVQNAYPTDNTERIVRGYDKLSGWNGYATSLNDSTRGWRPLLELL